uniref:CHK kinase-like domain-containing protein n=1 Tax=Panagrolaimus sp. JU765 TaxID=591449 RepID=A0AC34PXG3_9BILA
MNDLTKKIFGDCFDENQKLADGIFTNGFLIESLRTNDSDFIQIHGKRPVKNITSFDVSKGKGFISVVLKCTIEFVDSSSSSDVYTTILKVPGMESFTETLSDQIDSKIDFSTSFMDAHNIECDFYNIMASKLTRISLPKVYKTLPWIPGDDKKVIHMQDLSKCGKTIGVLDSLTIPQVRTLIRIIVEMQTDFFALPNDVRMKHYINISEINACLYGMVDKACDKLVELSNQDSFIKKAVSKYKKISINPDFYEYCINQCWKDMDMIPVLVHGDFWNGNILWKIDKNGDPTNEIAAIVDWQLTHENSPMEDLVRVVTLCTDGYTRRKVESFIFDEYLELLIKEMKSINRECPYTLEQIKSTYNHMFICQGFLGIMSIIWLVTMKMTEGKIEKAISDQALLQCKHILEDIDEFLTDKMKHLFEKYGK